MSRVLLRLLFVVALPLVLLSCWRIARVHSVWLDPVVRSRVLSTVMG